MKYYYLQIFITLFILNSCSPKNFNQLIENNPKTIERLKFKRYKIFENISEVKIYKIVKKVIDSSNNVIINDRKIFKILSINESNKLKELLLNDDIYENKIKNREFIPEYNFDFISKNGECTIVLAMETQQLSFICNLDGSIIFSIKEKGMKELNKLFKN